MAVNNPYTAIKGTLKARVTGLDAEIAPRVQAMGRQFDALFTALGDRPVDMSVAFEKLVGTLFGSIVVGTPVDTGFAHQSWRLLREEAAGSISFRIVNPVPYIVFLEFGSSKQAPKGMIRINLDLFRNDLIRATRRVLKNG